MQKQLRFLLFLLVALISSKGFGQKSTMPLNGIVKSVKNDVSNVLIVNLNSKKSTITDSLGLFTIEVNLRDSLQFTAVQYQTTKIVVTDEIFNKSLVVVNLKENVIDLDEVVVTPYNLTGQLNLDIERLDIEPAVTSSTLNLPNADVEKMTQSERLLLEADRGKYVNYYGLALTINTHKILNRISGRTKSFEEMVARDEDIELEKEIIAKFSKKTMSESFDIHEKNIGEFLNFCMLQEGFSELSQAANSIEIWEF